VPDEIKFGAVAKREIRALKAAQGHPNIMPFLGFTGPPKPNPFKPSKKQHDDFSEAPLLLGADLSHSDGDWDRSSSFDDDEDDDNGGDDYGAKLNPATMTAQQWDWVFSRQPWMGGIILPYIPLRLLDLIEIGWTAKRPLLVETCMRQILEGLAWLHDEAGLIHRDISPTNIVVTVGRYIKSKEESRQTGAGEDDGRGILQCMISDFGCATFYRPATTTVSIKAPEKCLPPGANSNNSSSSHGETKDQHVGDDDVNDDNDVNMLDRLRNPEQSYNQKLTFEVGTRAYRAPELLFSSDDYTNAIDIWSAGVIFAEMYLGGPLFSSDTDITQICAIVKVLGAITEQSWPEYQCMPDAGKLLFNIRERTPLSQILLSRQATAATSNDPSSFTISTKCDEYSLEGTSLSSCEPRTLISLPALELIENMIVYSGAARPSAKAALEFRDRYIMRTKDLELQSDPRVQSQQQQVLIMEDVNHHHDGVHEFLQQCIIDERELLSKVRVLRKRRSNEHEDPASMNPYDHPFGLTDSDIESYDFDQDNDDSDSNHVEKMEGEEGEIPMI
ncbi:hypothetical protein BGZ65_005390, partial [Modicella reniformis]